MMCLLHSELGRVSPQWVSYVARNLSGQLCQKTLDHRLWFSYIYIYIIYNTHLCQLIGFDFHIIYIYIYLYICIDRFALQKYVVGVCVYCSISPCIFDIYIYVQYIQLYIYVHTHIHHVFWSFLMPGPGQFFEKLDKNHSGFLTWQAH